MLTRPLRPDLIAGVVSLAVLLCVAFVPLGLPGRIKARFGVRIPESGWYGLADINSFVERLGSAGLRMYRRQLAWDMVFATLLGLSLSFLNLQAWSQVWGRGSQLPYLIALVPVAFAIFDVAEDVILLCAVRSNNLCPPVPPPRREPRLALAGPVRRIACPVCALGPAGLFVESLAVLAEGVAAVLFARSLSRDATHLIDGRLISAARVFTGLKYLFVMASLLALVSGAFATIGLWPEGMF